MSTIADLKQQFLLHAEHPAQAELLFNNFTVLFQRAADEIYKRMKDALDAAPSEITTREQAFEYAMTQLREFMRPSA